MRNHQHFTLSPPPDSCKKQGARLISVTLTSAVVLIVVSLLAVVTHAATLPGSVEAPVELSREWQFEHKVVEFNNMFGGSREIELRQKR